MIRLNITIPDDVGKQLSRIKNKSHFIAVTLRERFLAERRKATEDLLEQAYKKAAKEDKVLVEALDGASGDGID